MAMLRLLALSLIVVVSMRMDPVSGYCKELRSRYITLKYSINNLSKQFNSLKAIVYRPLPPAQAFFIFVRRAVTWVEAQSTCKRQGGSLAYIENRAELLQLQRVVRGSYRLWIGGNDIGHEGKWTWVGGHGALRYSNWARGEPNNNGNHGEHCLTAIHRSLQYNDESCNKKFFFACRLD